MRLYLYEGCDVRTCTYTMALVCIPRREKWSYALILIPWCTGALVLIARCKDLKNTLVPIAWRKDVIYKSVIISIITAWRKGAM